MHIIQILVHTKHSHVIVNQKSRKGQMSFQKDIGKMKKAHLGHPIDPNFAGIVSQTNAACGATSKWWQRRRGRLFECQVEGKGAKI
jgi:hypothetical protein